MKKYTINLTISEDGPVWEAPVLFLIEVSGRTARQVASLLEQASVNFTEVTDLAASASKATQTHTKSAQSGAREDNQ